ncbi:RNA polymerase sigma factor [Pedobacter caeni]|uniref:RNA polymerase sigma-70 factor, ECF subfamily n=1 Tax=Pedobacter caeni TaxID=288992 RepID=A0A1M5HPA6_9SPHI|nr:sigma-70 family RNA polymerase sigma factor [Pedobacter caeni]SHG17728.1 RNA polymerase sigma-70 factor, ECF subfamily [Pedobacter caeni]
MFDEKEEIPKVLHGDLKAFDRLVKQYEKLVFHVVYRLVNEKEDAEDICQEVFIKIYKSLKSFAFQSKLSTWIARIAYLSAVNHLKKNKRASLTMAVDDLENYHFTDKNPENVLVEKDVARYVNHLISLMPDHYRTVLTLYHLNEFSYQEIEDITGMPEGTVKSHLFRARKLLKEKLELYLKNEIS